MTDDDPILRQLTVLGGLQDAAIDLAEAALLLAARGRPGVAIDRFRHHLTLLAGAMRAEAGKLDAADDVRDQADVLAGVMAGLMGYAGDVETYDDLMNANLMHVIDRRRGLPVALAILYLHAARSLGWDARGLTFPGHFLIRLQAGGQRAILDPFHGGQALDTGELRTLLKKIQGTDAELTPAHFGEVGNRDILLRLQNNIKIRLVQANDMEQAANVLADMAAFAPRHAATLLELGVMQGHLGQMKLAMDTLGRCVAAAGAGPLANDARAMLARFQTQLN